VGTLLGSSPLALATDEGSELLQSPAAAFVGGLGVSTLLTLVVISTFYLVAHAGRERLAARFGRGRAAPDESISHGDFQASS
jgi:Cu/Ag efflux pump CusA